MVVDTADPFKVSHLIPVAVLARAIGGEPLTADDQAAYDAYRKACDEAERRRGVLGLTDLSDTMRSGATAPEMLVPGMIVKGKHHTYFGAKGASKTFVLLAAAGHVLANGGTVIWCDLEMGASDMADRLLALGVPSDFIEERFVYLEFPTLDRSAESVALWDTLLRLKRPDLIVVDAYTEVLAQAGLNENLGTDVEKWVQSYIMPVRRVTEAASVMIDHTGLNDQSRPVASRQKGAGVRLEMAVRTTKPFGRALMGRIELKVHKNACSADVPEVQLFNVGGDGFGHFTFEPVPAPSTKDPIEGGGTVAVEQKIAEVVRKNGVVKSYNALKKLVGGNKTKFDQALGEVVDSNLWPVEARQTERGWIEYHWVGPEEQA